MWNGTLTLAGMASALALAGSGMAVTDQQVNPYTDRGSYYELARTTNVTQGERVDIAKDRAAVTIRGWNGEYAITVEPQIPSASHGATNRPFIVQANRPLLSKQIQFKNGGVTAFVEPTSTNAFDIDFTLDSKPVTNVFEYKISGTEDFDFLYQPPLTQQEIDEGAERPDNVVGSYAVYSKTKANHRVGETNYATGKIAHIYRPKAVDANGDSVWATLKYQNGVLSVTVPQSFLDGAVYPVRVDPTFGYTTIGGSTIDFRFSSQYYDACSHYTVSENGVLDSMTAYTSGNGSAQQQTAIYNYIDGGSGDNFLASSTAYVHPNDTSWATSTYTDTVNLTGGNDYWLCATGDNGLFYYDADATGREAQDFAATTRIDNWDANIGAFSQGLIDNKYSIYAAYTVSGGGSSNGTVLLASGVASSTGFTSPTVYIDGVATTTFPDTKWHHVVITDSTGISISDLHLGRIGSTYFDGQLDDLRLYNRVLSASEVSRLYGLGGTTHVNTTINTNTDLTSGLAGHWTFDGPDMNWSSTTAEVLDTSGNSYNGNATNLTSISSSPGRIGQALDFNGSNDYVAVPDAVANASGDVTISLWANKGASTARRVLAMLNNSTPLFVTANGDSGKYYHCVHDGSTDHLRAAANDNQWYHIVCVYTSGTLSAGYLNGVAMTDSGGSTWGNPSTNDTVTIGARDSGTTPFEGKIDDVRIYNRALSAAEVKRLYQLGL